MKRAVSVVITIVAWIAGPAATADLVQGIPSGAATTAGIELAALGHDAHSDVYRIPAVVVAPGATETLRFRTASQGADMVTLHLTDQASGAQQFLAMRRVARAVPCYQVTLSRVRCDFWQIVLHPSVLGVLSYRFVVRRGQHVAYYADRLAQFGKMGVGSRADAPNDYRIHVVAPRFPVIPALKDGVMYQIMPDRFANGDTSNDISVTRPRYDYP
ncbi:MAG: hypothetical protein JO287_20050, partial [Pseudonocardiales bacterium]|nr:hypothetical protein [Pseudonocardiales bacterium]